MVSKVYKNINIIVGKTNFQRDVLGAFFLLVAVDFLEEILVEARAVLESGGDGGKVEMLGCFEHAVAVVYEHVEGGGGVEI